MVFNDSGAVVWRWDQQEPFGENVPDEDPSTLGTFDLPLRLPGQYADEDTALSYNGFRDYDSVTGRYVEADPIGLAGGISLFSYAYDPLTEVDLLGLMGRAPTTAAAGGSAASLVPKEPGYIVLAQALSIVVPVLPFTGFIGTSSCGAYGFQAPNVFDSSSIEKACAAHDKCYETCGIWKDDCDKILKTNILRACGSGVRCVVGAQIYYQVVQRAGGRTFLSSREKCRRGGCG